MLSTLISNVASSAAICVSSAEDGIEAFKYKTGYYMSPRPFPVGQLHDTRDHLAQSHYHTNFIFHPARMNGISHGLIDPDLKQILVTACTYWKIMPTQLTIKYCISYSRTYRYPVPRPRSALYIRTYVAELAERA